MIQEERKAQESGNAMLLKSHKFKTISSDRYSSQLDNEDVSDSFVAFSQRTLMTHAPTIYEELIQKYEGDIRNHIRIEQQMKLHSDSVINKLEDKEKEYDRMIANLKEHEKRFKKQASHFKIEAKIFKEENEALKKALEKKIEKILNVERDLKEANKNISVLEKEVLKAQHTINHEPTPNKVFHH